MSDITQPIDGARLLRRLTVAIRRYVVLDLDAACLVAAWALGTYFFGEDEDEIPWEIYPRLGIVSPTKRCGKTRLTQDVLGALVRRPDPVDDVTAAVLFRLVDAAGRPTLLLDELDAKFKGDPEAAQAIRGILNSGHRRGGRARRCNPKSHAVESFSTFTPAALAAIRSLPDTVTDRSILIPMRRRSKGEIVQKFRRAERKELKKLTAECEAWAAQDDVRGAVKHLIDENSVHIPEELGDREADNVEPLLAVASAAGGRWQHRIRKAYLRLRGVAAGVVDSEPLNVQLLADVVEIVTAAPVPKHFPTAELVASLRAIDWEIGGKPINARTLAGQLRPFDVRPTQFKDGGENLKGYAVADIQHAATRYLSTPSSATATVKPSETGLNPQNTVAVADVPPPTTGPPSPPPTPEIHAVTSPLNSQKTDIAQSTESTSSPNTDVFISDVNLEKIEADFYAHRASCKGADLAVGADGTTYFCSACGRVIAGPQTADAPGAAAGGDDIFADLPNDPPAESGLEEGIL